MVLAISKMLIGTANIYRGAYLSRFLKKGDTIKSAKKKEGTDTFYPPLTTFDYYLDYYGLFCKFLPTSKTA